MSMPPHAIPAIPEETIRVARAAFPRGNMAYQCETDEKVRRAI
jgi:hypothetical protein